VAGDRPRRDQNADELAGVAGGTNRELHAAGRPVVAVVFLDERARLPERDRDELQPHGRLHPFESVDAACRL
jgi:hypothetical protein